MAIYFYKVILKNKTNINNFGNMYRDFTYISDIVKPITKLLNVIPKKKGIKKLKTLKAQHHSNYLI